MKNEKINDWIAEWRSMGDLLQVDGHNVFVHDNEQLDVPVVAVLHGYPSSSFDYRHVLKNWTDRYRVVLHDHLGFGLSDKSLDYSYSLMDQARIAIEVWQALGLTEIHLVAHDYGTSVCTEILALREAGQLTIDIQSVTLCNGSVHIELADLRWIQHLLLNKLTGPLVARLGSEGIYVHQMRRLWANPSTCNTDELRALYRMNVSGGGKKVLHQITQYIRERYTHWDRWIGALTRLNLPAHIVWAQEDPVAVKAIGEALYQEIPDAKISRLVGLGHYPMLENADHWSAVVSDFIHAQ